MIVRRRFRGGRRRTIPQWLTRHRDVVLDRHRDPGERELVRSGRLSTSAASANAAPADHHEGPHIRVAVRDPCQCFGDRLCGRARPGTVPPRRSTSP